ncbi:MAG TPA: hypothetical protein PLW24_07265 [Burkholderiaceae bacterium]|nr:hypothetical protein [Burkholderiaceae bacterium]
MDDSSFVKSGTPSDLSGPSVPKFIVSDNTGLGTEATKRNS